MTINGHSMRVFTDDSHCVQPIIDAARAAGLVIRAVRPMRPSLEDLFMEAVTDPATGKAMTPGAEKNGPSSAEQSRAKGGAL